MSILASPSDALGNGADDTLAIQSTLVEGVETYVLPPIQGGYTTGPLTLPSTLRNLVFESQVYQRAAGETTFSGDATVHDLTIWNPQVQGKAGLGGTATNSADTAFRFSGANKVVAKGGKVSRFTGFSFYAEGGSEIAVDGLQSIECYAHIRFRGVKKPKVTDALVQRSCLDRTVFTVGIGFDSTDGHNLGYCTNMDVRNCRVEDLGYSQAVLLHAGVGFDFQGNKISGCAMGISANPYNAADVIAAATITTNRILGLTGLTGGNPYTTDIDHGISLMAGRASGGGMCPNISGVVMADNNVVGANRVLMDYHVGAYTLAYVDDLTAYGNHSSAAGINGMAIQGPVTRCNIGGFSANGQMPGSGESNAVRVMAPCTGWLGNIVSDAALGVRFADPSSGLTLGPVTMIGGGSNYYGR